MNAKVYFEGQTTQAITLEVNGHIIRNVPLEKAIDRYGEYNEILKKIQECCLAGDENSRNIWNKYKRILEIRREYMSGEYVDSTNEHHSEHRTLQEILSNIEDTNIREEIETTLQIYQQVYGEDIQFLAEGAESTAFSIGGQVVKFGSLPIEKKMPLTLEPTEVIKYDKYHAMRVFPKLRTGNITTDELRLAYDSLRDSGFIWRDVKQSNLGWAYSKTGRELKIIDDGDIWREEKVFEEGYSSVLEFLDSREAMYEIEYQKAHNPDFDINNLKKYFSKYESDQETQIYVSKLEIQFAEWEKEQEKLLKDSKSDKLHDFSSVKNSSRHKAKLLESISNIFSKIKKVFVKGEKKMLGEVGLTTKLMMGKNDFINTMQSGRASDMEFAEAFDKRTSKEREKSIEQQK